MPLEPFETLLLRLLGLGGGGRELLATDDVTEAKMTCSESHQ